MKSEVEERPRRPSWAVTGGTGVHGLMVSFAMFPTVSIKSPTDMFAQKNIPKDIFKILKFVVGMIN